MYANWICTYEQTDVRLRRIFNFQKAYQVLDELVIAGELQESSKKSVLRVVMQGDAVEEAENNEDVRCLCDRDGISTCTHKHERQS